MPKITNNTKRVLNFVTSVKDGKAITDELKPGETKVVEADMNSAQVKGMLHAGAISLEKRAASKATKAAKVDIANAAGDASPAAA